MSWAQRIFNHLGVLLNYLKKNLCCSFGSPVALLPVPYCRYWEAIPIREFLLRQVHFLPDRFYIHWGHVYFCYSQSLLAFLVGNGFIETCNNFIVDIWHVFLPIK